MEINSPSIREKEMSLMTNPLPYPAERSFTSRMDMTERNYATIRDLFKNFPEDEGDEEVSPKP
jgi:hypothetical protein